MRAPWSTRLSTSRPYWSLPSRNAEPGGFRASRGAVRMGSRGLSQGAPTASRTSSVRIARPTSAPRWRRSRLVEADPRVDEGIGEVDHEVDEDVGRGHEEDRSLDQGKVLVEDAADQEPADPG